MPITLMTPDERAVIAARLDGQNPAAPELVDATVSAANGIMRSGRSGAAVGRLLAADVRAVAARLIAAEQELSTTRDVLARILAAQEAGDYYSPDDVLHELDRAGIHLRANVESAGVAADAAETAWALR
ncbi:hypothetical protein [Streptomyces sp. NBC_01237]|uniref:hypothetical protein n=1 Tax=Streptomyces sp. NBC_01237 TaxID=2903790 RepID=UPI002DD9F95E|nr:hypothetical protein [Streptomyces sp. NBC_01237]WRZ73808.1 hypothetical protein OG251_20420 [Streptomyces sp. NBC_01237]